MAPQCPFSHSSKPHIVSRGDSKQLFRCYVCEEETKEYVESYCCTCGKECHIGCYKFQPEYPNHPYHPHHALKLISSNSSSHGPILWPDDVAPLPPNENLGGCKCCRRQLQGLYYQCSECKFSINATCAINAPSLSEIKNPKIHKDSTFTLFPRRISLPCDACGEPLNDSSDHAYICLDRNYIAHGKCIQDLPSVIKLTRHPHRLSHNHSLVFPDHPSRDPPSLDNTSLDPPTPFPWYPLSLFSPKTLSPCLISPDFPSLPPPPGFSCGVCQETVKVNYGHYSCSIKGCQYAVHSKCATRKDVWDEIDLEEGPEDSEKHGGVKNLFQENEDKTILHCNHEEVHKKFLKEKIHLFSGIKFCQACLLLIVDSDSFYYCKECDFILHKSCAFLPPKIDHPLHKHPLILLPFPTNLYFIQFKTFVEGMFNCSGCGQRGCGFMYRCKEKGCRFQLDVRCASLVQPFKHGSHDHPLFLNLTKGKCMRCHSNSCSPFYLECKKCKLFLGLKCAMLPAVAHYKYDSHPLHLCYGETYTTSFQYWCEVCESTLNAKEWFYTCDHCRVTLHVTCLLGKEAYMKPHHTIKIYDYEVEIIPNKGNPRPRCNKCENRCVDALVFNSFDRYWCTLRCTQKSLDREKREEDQKGQEEEVEN